MKTKDKPGVVFYFEFLPMIAKLKPMQRLALYEGMLYYAMDGKEPELRREAALVWDFIRPVVDRDAERYKKIVAARVKAGKARGEQMRREAKDKRGEHMLNLLSTESQQSTINNQPSTVNDQPSTINDQSSAYNGHLSDSSCQTQIIKNQVVNQGERGLSPSFTPPDYNDVMYFCLREGLSFKPEEFLDYYTANGWMVGQNPMRDWQAAARRWERKERVH